MATSKAVAITTTDLVVPRFASTQQILTALETGQRLAIEESEFTQADFIAKKVEAQSVEDLFSDGGTLEAPSNHLNEILNLIAFQGLRSSDLNPDGLGAYAVVDAVDRDGEQFSLAIGNTDSLVTVVRLHELDAYPVRVRFVRGLKTKNGYEPINMKLVKEGETF